jgi:hypothetical protein
VAKFVLDLLILQDKHNIPVSKAPTNTFDMFQQCTYINYKTNYCMTYSERTEVGNITRGYQYISNIVIYNFL